MGPVTRIWRGHGPALLVIISGLAFCWIWAGPRVLDPTSIGWLDRGDRAMHTLGWWFFRDAPWTWPPGANPNYGLEIAGSVALSDSLPLFAIPIKLVGPALPDPFQYWGIWFGLCFALQGFFGYRLVREFDVARPMAVVAGLFFIVAPIFLWRLTQHMALAGHWTILAALWLYVRRTPPRGWAWPLLIATTAAIHGYLLAICAALWLASLAQRLWSGRIARSQAAIEAVATLPAVGLVLWASGTFMASSFALGGFGFFRSNLLGFVDADGWSRILPDIPSGGGDYEGWSYPGIGILLLLLIALPSLRLSLLTRLIAPRWLPLLVTCCALLIFAMSNSIALGKRELLFIALPPSLTELASTFRSSGRMIWPVVYLATLVALVASHRRFGRWAAALYAVALVLQVIDTAPWMRFREVPSNPSIEHAPDGFRSGLHSHRANPRSRHPGCRQSQLARALLLCGASRPRDRRRLPRPSRWPSACRAPLQEPYRSSTAARSRQRPSTCSRPAPPSGQPTRQDNRLVRQDRRLYRLCKDGGQLATEHGLTRFLPHAPLLVPGQRILANDTTVRSWGANRRLPMGRVART